MHWLYLLLGVFTFVELNCENLFDTQHDSLKQDMEYLPESYHHWNKSRYWNKLNHIGQSIIACGKHETNGFYLILLHCVKSKMTVWCVILLNDPYFVRHVMSM